jgi:hypothetical protein
MDEKFILKNLENFIILSNLIISDYKIFKLKVSK